MRSCSHGGDVAGKNGSTVLVKAGCVSSLSPYQRSGLREDLLVTRSVNSGRSLEELEGDRWPAPPADASRLVATVHELRGRPIETLTVEELRLLIGQDVGLVFLLPLALEVLRGNPLAEGDMYEGDLLSAVLARGPAVWGDNPNLAGEVSAIVEHLTDLPPGLQQQVDQYRKRPGS